MAVPDIARQKWPADGLERVPDCPVCGSSARSLLHEGLFDQVFFVAPGEWSLWQCERCRSAWLDPRPNEATIGIAYGRYYTHDEVVLPEPHTAFQHLRAALGNGYRNYRYGTHLTPALRIGPLIALLLPPLRWTVDVAYRFLPHSHRPKRVLDIGCGNGTWLELARGAGWQIAGVEPDPISRQQALDHGIEVRESVAAWLNDPLGFDYVTMSHVIEHVHDPLALLRDAYKLLNPGGGIYIDTPSLDALGHEIYGRHWRGLETPRHLVLFNRDSLSQAVTRSGFRDLRYARRFYTLKGMSELSRRMAAGLDPYSNEFSSDLPPPPTMAQRLRSMLTRRRMEFLTMTATKPK